MVLAGCAVAGCGGPATHAPSASPATRPQLARVPHPQSTVAICRRSDLQAGGRWSSTAAGVTATISIYNRATSPCHLQGTPRLILRGALPLDYREERVGQSSTRAVILTSGPQRRAALAEVVWSASCPAGGRRADPVHDFVVAPGTAGLLPVHPRDVPLPPCTRAVARRPSIVRVSALRQGPPAAP